MTDRPPEDPIDSRLEKLARATDALQPRADFGARVMRAVEPQDWFVHVLRPARRLVPLAAVAAIVAMVFAARGARSYDDALVESYDRVGLE